MEIFRSARLLARVAVIHVSPGRHIPSMRTLTQFVAAAVTVAVMPVYPTIASSVAHADPVATTATVSKGSSTLKGQL
jgi:hypothetical protein